MSRTTSFLQVLSITALFVLLMIGAMACPTLMPVEGTGGMPCPHHHSAPCPPSVCQAGSPYLMTRGDIVVTLETAALPVTAEAFFLALGVAPVLSDFAVPSSPPFPLFVRTHSLRI